MLAQSHSVDLSEADENMSTRMTRRGTRDPCAAFVVVLGSPSRVNAVSQVLPRIREERKERNLMKVDDPHSWHPDYVGQMFEKLMKTFKRDCTRASFLLSSLLLCVSDGVPQSLRWLIGLKICLSTLHAGLNMLRNVTLSEWNVGQDYVTNWEGKRDDYTLLILTGLWLKLLRVRLEHFVSKSDVLRTTDNMHHEHRGPPKITFDLQSFENWFYSLRKFAFLNRLLLEDYGIHRSSQRKKKRNWQESSFQQEIWFSKGSIHDHHRFLFAGAFFCNNVRNSSPISGSNSWERVRIGIITKKKLTFLRCTGIQFEGVLDFLSSASVDKVSKRATVDKGESTLLKYTNWLHLLKIFVNV